MVEHVLVRMHVPSTPSTSQVGGGAPLELVLELLDEELVVLLDEEVEEELLVEEVVLLEEELLEEELLPVGVQHSMSAAPGQ